MDVPPEIRRKFVRRMTVGGLKLKVELLPGLWLKAPFYGIIVSSTTERTVSFKIDRPYARATKADFDRLLRRIRVEPCTASGCRKRFLEGEDWKTVNPRRLCKRHWVADLEEQGKKEQAEAAARAARDDARAQAKGMRYKAWVWIHGDGDDYAVVRYFAARPTKAQLQKIARGKKSKILDDHGVERLLGYP
jgi:regulator of protease activity HflC (stomatin/prohibitin superfamily)